mmetsp:Transcript_535/g.1220  ORF Transcript_535/g.1220 Transcript_535/m.1220 type:complete len:97 (-) Transcript_535:226-516(-)
MGVGQQRNCQDISSRCPRAMLSTSNGSNLTTTASFTLLFENVWSNVSPRQLRVKHHHPARRTNANTSYNSARLFRLSIFFFISALASLSFRASSFF